MAAFVAFLRAVNVVPQRRVAMARARSVLENLGCTDVSSFTNSGNLLFGASGRTSELERRIRPAIEDEFGLELTTFVRTAKQVREIAAADPFGTIETGHTHFALFPLNRMTAAQKRDVEAMSNDFDEVVVRSRDVHWLMRGRSIDTTLGPKRWLDVLPGTPTTARNLTLLRRVAAKLPD